MSALSAGTVRLIGTFAIGAFILAGADGRVLAQTGGKIPELTSNPSSWAWVRIRADGRNARPEHCEKAIAPAPRVFVSARAARLHLAAARFAFLGASCKGAPDIERRIDVAKVDTGI